MELSFGRKYGLIFGGMIAVAVLVLSVFVFPFWHLIREDTFEDVIIIKNVDGTCYVETKDSVPKIIRNCVAQPGDNVKIKFGKDLAWAEIVSP